MDDDFAIENKNMPGITDFKKIGQNDIGRRKRCQ